jgi:branched-chain amino acid transport system substrate-binding protein
MRRAAELAVRQINGSGGIGGRPIELVARDDFGDPDSAVDVASELIAAGVVAVVGHVYSGTTLAAAPVYNGAGVTQISPSSSSPMVTQAGDWTFRICPSDVQQAQALARFVSDDLHLQRGTILYLNDEYGRGLRRTFDTEFSRLGGEIDAEDPYLTTRPDLTAYFDRLVKRDHSEFVFLAGNQEEAAHILRQARALKVTVPFLGGDGLEGLQRDGSIADGTFISNGYLSDFDTPENRRFVQEYHNAYPGAQPPTQAAAATFDILYLLRDRIAQVGTDRRRVRDAIAGVGRISPVFRGVTGDIAFDENGDVPRQRVVIGRIAGGSIRAVEGL